MKKGNTPEKVKQSRREAIKKIGITSAFVVPTIVTFNIKDFQAYASGGGFQAKIMKAQWSAETCWRNTEFFDDYKPFMHNYWAPNFDKKRCIDQLSTFYKYDHQYIQNLIESCWKR